MQYNDGYSETVFSFANNINTVDGGSHLFRFRTSLTAHQLRGPADGLFKDVKENLTGDDVREGLVAVIRVKLQQPQFEGPDQGKLNSDMPALCRLSSTERTGAFFEQNTPWPARSYRQWTRPGPAKRPQGPRPDAAAKGARRCGLPGKLPTARNANPNRCELFLVEGKSAAYRNKAATALPGDPFRSRARFSNWKKRATTRCWRTKIRAMITASHASRKRIFIAKCATAKIFLMTTPTWTVAYPHPAADVLLPPHAGVDQAQ